MCTKLNAAVSSILLAAVSVVMLCGFTMPEEKDTRASGALVTLSSGRNSLPQAPAQTMEQPLRLAQFSTNGLALERPTENPYTYSKKNAPAGAAPASACMASVNAMPKTGNSVIDTRCKLVAFEVCMHEKIGTISQSQDSRKQCEIMQGLGGPAACRQPCIEAAKLPIGGSGTVVTKENTYTELTPFAVACYKKIMDVPGGNAGACSRNEALQCLMNGSSAAGVNAAIRQERKNACADFYQKYPNEPCVPCAKGEVRVDYDSRKVDLDAEKCTPALAAAGRCSMPVR
ncbi:hypothetical protein [Rhodoferax sp.]|uniref:hypothetical protein n=1 Tax=Rhodoferax sp. TaxID=50421 RepID=UPI002720A9AD|nr:hypothetical protein [Rhodoferax sp.]MDO9199087.1 hypothetical protein [Rhodoferax sp.]